MDLSAIGTMNEEDCGARSAGRPRNCAGAAPTCSASSERERLVERGARRDVRPRPARAADARPDHHRHPGQRPEDGLRRAARAGWSGPTSSSTTSSTCSRSSSGSSAGSAGGSTRRRRWWTPGCPTAAASTPSSRRWPWTARCSRSAGSAASRCWSPTWSPSRRSPPEMVEFLSACVKARVNMVISGGTGSGKTTLLNALSAFIPDDERVATIEDAAELRLQQPHVVRMETRPAEHRGDRRGHDPRPGPQRPADAARPDHHRRVPRRRGAGHAPGHEHRPRRRR